MTTRTIRNESDLFGLEKFLHSQTMPFTVDVTKGAKRSNDQNRLQRKWLLEIAEQRPDETAEQIRGYCKLRMGVPIMRNENEKFREVYDRLIRPHSYEEKLEMMMMPLDFPVTRNMTTKQKSTYLDAVYHHWTGQGYILTTPPQRGMTDASGADVAVLA